MTRPTFDELLWPQPTTRRERLEAERELKAATAARCDFEYSNWGLAAIWILNGVLLTAIGITVWYITSWFIL
jgi:hypothetical protein